jgi:hypothetical protein
VPCIFAVRPRPISPLLEAWDGKAHVVAATGSDGAFAWDCELTRDFPWRELLVGEAAGRPVGRLHVFA